LRKHRVGPDERLLRLDKHRVRPDERLLRLRVHRVGPSNSMFALRTRSFARIKRVIRPREGLRAPCKGSSCRNMVGFGPVPYFD